MSIDHFVLVYLVLNIVCIVADIIIAKFSFDKKELTGNYLAMVALFAALVNISYVTSVFIDVKSSYFGVSLFSSFYFLGIDLMLYFLVNFGAIYTRYEKGTLWRRIKKIILFFMVIDIISLLINPFHEWAVHYTFRDTAIANFKYEMYFLYKYHLTLSYTLISIFIVTVFTKMKEVPSNYRRQYIYLLLGVALILVWNAAFLFIPVLKIYSFIDYSICGYCFAIAIMYWICYVYSKKGMMRSFKNSIYENINQGIILFDYEKRYILDNERIHKILKHNDFDENITLDAFISDCKLPNISVEKEASIQCYIEGDYGLKPIRCDSRHLKNKKNETIGYLLIFTDSQLDTDLLTGFQNYDSFKRFIADSSLNNNEPYTVCVLDINGLSDINKGLGRNEGDQIIHHLANTMKECFPKETYYIRGEEANLIAIVFSNREDEIEYILSNVEKRFPQKFQYGIAIDHEGKISIDESIDQATESMREKKLIDTSSKSSNMLTSLIEALNACDHDTEAHVRRTQLLGKELGKRIGLSDSQQSDLSLLCLLHDIGKIGVPLEILNKTGELTEAEWKVIRSHVDKGYQIARSTPELSRISDMILHHHERWDGTGYPDGMSKETIPLLSRIISVIDSYDAMVNNRSYRKAISKNVAIEELKNNAGTQFDPYIVSEFLLMLESEGIIYEKEEASFEPASQEALKPISHDVHEIIYSRYILNDADTIIEIDDQFEKMTGYTKEDIKSNTISQFDLIPLEDQAAYMRMIAEAISSNGFAYIEHRLKRKDDTILYVFCLGRRYYNSALRTDCSEIFITDSTSTYSMKQLASEEQEKAKNRLKQWENKYRRDPLTSLLTHEAFQNDVEQQMLASMYKIMLIMIDVDHFKEYNDTYGHRAGDEYLILIAQTIEKTLRKDDLACRMGGDEYACAIFFDMDVDEEVMKDRAHQIFDKVNMTITSTKGGTSVSMGYAIADENIRTFNQLYEKADQALYRSKENGRGRIS